MNLQIEQSQVGGITILSLSGSIVIGSEASSLRSVLDAVETSHNLILDLAHVGRIDSTGLGVLVAAHSHAARAGGAVRLLHLSKKHIQLLVLTKLTTVFQIFDDQAAAVDSFFPDREQSTFDILEFLKRAEPGNRVR